MPAYPSSTKINSLQDVPEVVAKVLLFLSEREAPTPMKELPSDLNDLDVIRVGEHRKLIGRVCWCEGSPTTAKSNHIVVGSGPGWILAEKTDSPERVHLALTQHGRAIASELRLAAKFRHSEKGQAPEPPASPRPPQAGTPANTKAPARRGRKTDTDPAADAKVADAWATGQYPFYRDLAGELKMSERAVSQALERHRKRQHRKGVK